MRQTKTTVKTNLPASALESLAAIRDRIVARDFHALHGGAKGQKTRLMKPPTAAQLDRLAQMENAARRFDRFAQSA